MRIELSALRATSRWQRVVGAIGVVVVLWVGSDLQRIISCGGDVPPGEEHDPSQFDHG